MSLQERLEEEEEEGEVPFLEHIKQRIISTNNKCCSSDSLCESEEVIPSAPCCGAAVEIAFVTLTHVLLVDSPCEQRGFKPPLPSTSFQGVLGCSSSWECLHAGEAPSCPFHGSPAGSSATGWISPGGRVPS